MKAEYLISAAIISLLWCIIANVFYQFKLSKIIKIKYELIGTLTGVIVYVLCALIIYMSTNLLLDVIPYICIILDFYGLIKFE